MGQLASVLTNPDDPYRDDRVRAYEAERAAQYRRCQDQLVRGAAKVAFGSREEGVVDIYETVRSPVCNPGPRLAPSAIPRPPSPRLRLNEPGDLKYPGRG